VRCVVAMGGDGTFREVAAGLLESARREEVTLGMLPAGTANNHGKSFGLSSAASALERNVRVVAAGLETRLDAGRLISSDERGRELARAAFFDSVGLGIGAAVIAARNVDRAHAQRAGWLERIYRDELVYGGALLRTLAGARPDDGRFFATITLDDEPPTRMRLAELLVRGTRVYAGGWVVDPRSQHDDGLFEVIPFPTRAGWVARAAAGLCVGPLVRGGFAMPNAPPGTRRARRIGVEIHVAEGGAPPPGQMDGEELPRASRLSIEVEPRALRLVVP